MIEVIFEKAGTKLTCKQASAVLCALCALCKQASAAVFPVLLCTITSSQTPQDIQKRRLRIPSSQKSSQRPGTSSFPVHLSAHIVYLQLLRQLRAREEDRARGRVDEGDQQAGVATRSAIEPCMEDTDPDTELARQLHREWNGLNRTKPRSFRRPESLGGWAVHLY